MREKTEKKRWKPSMPVSKGATAYHDAVVRAGYYNRILDEFVSVAVSKVREGQNIVDFGAGTGVSALKLSDKLPAGSRVWLVDNSPAWLGKAYEVLKGRDNVDFFLLEKHEDHYATLSEVIGKGKADHVMSANTLHLIPDIEEVFKGIFQAVKPGGFFIFESGNITRSDRPEGALLVDNTVREVHDIALEMVRTDDEFKEYRADLDSRIKMYEPQRKFVFPEPRSVDVYHYTLRQAGFVHLETKFLQFRVNYDEWLEFLRVKRLQAGILPEIGGNEPTEKEEGDRDRLITKATLRCFEDLKKNNPLADEKGFTIEVCYVIARRPAAARELAGKTALITGASRGIGKAIAMELASQGADIILNYRSNDEEARKTAEDIKKMAGVRLEKSDVADPGQVRAMVDSLGREGKRIDILVNNAGIILDRSIQKMTHEEWKRVLDTNLNSVYHVTHGVLPLMNEGGRIINISSVAALAGNPGQTNYTASKAGVIGFTKSLAKEVAKRGVTANVIAPGLVESDILADVPEERKKEITKIISLGRIGQPEDIAKVAGFLASPKAAYITGQILRVDGGMQI